METKEEAKKMKTYETPRVEQINMMQILMKRLGMQTDEETDQTDQNSSIHNGHCYQQENSQIQPQGSVELQDERTRISRKNHEGTSLCQRAN